MRTPRRTVQILALFTIAIGGYGLWSNTSTQSAQAQDMGRTYASPQSSAMSAEQTNQVWEALESSHWISDGNEDADRIVYTFTDANCPYCKAFWEEARPWIDDEQVELRHILVGIIREDSAAKAAWLLEQEDPEQALTAHSNGSRPAKAESHTGGARRQVHENNQLFRSLGLAATPTSIARKNNQLLPVPGLPQGQRLELLMGSSRP